MDYRYKQYSIEETQMTEKHLKSSTSVTIREMQIKTLRLHLKSIRMANINITNSGEDVE